MLRHAVVCRGGPLDGHVFSTSVQQNEIIGMGGMADGDIYDRVNDPITLDSLVEDRDRASALEPDSEHLDDPVEAMKERLFPNQQIEDIAVFQYRGNV